MDTPAARQTVLYRMGKILPGLLVGLALILIILTCYAMFVQLPRVQGELQNLVKDFVSSIADHQSASAEVRASYHSPATAPLLSTVSLACLVCWLSLIYRLACDARRIGGARMQTGPAQCVLFFLIPIGNIWMPLKALQNINEILSPQHRLTGTLLIWTAWTISVPVTLITLLYTLVQPFITFVSTFSGWQANQGVLTDDMIGQGIYNLFNSILGPVILYNGSVFILSLTSSVLMALYFDFRSRRLPASAA